MFTKADIEKYFMAEKQQSFLFIIIGIAAIVAAVIFFFFLKTNFYKGVAVPLLLTGLLCVIVGYTVYKRSDEDRKRNVYAYDMNPSQLKEKELPRMKTVMKNFTVYRYVEMVLIVTGVFLFFYFKNDTTKQLWKGFGIGLGIMALILLLADYVAAKRGNMYTEGIESFIKTT